MGKKNTPQVYRLNPALLVVLKELVGATSVNSIAIAVGASQGHLNDQVKERKPVTLESLDQVARYRNKSATQLLTALRDAALELDRVSRGWDATPTTPLLGVVEPQTRAQRGAAVDHDKQGQAQAGDAKPKKKQGGSRRG